MDTSIKQSCGDMMIILQRVQNILVLLEERITDLEARVAALEGP